MMYDVCMMDESITALTIRYYVRRASAAVQGYCVRVCKNDPYLYIQKEADLGCAWAEGLYMEVSLLAMVTSHRRANNHGSQGILLSAFSPGSHRSIDASLGLNTKAID